MRIPSEQNVHLRIGFSIFTLLSELFLSLLPKGTDLWSDTESMCPWIVDAMQLVGDTCVDVDPPNIFGLGITCG